MTPEFILDSSSFVVLADSHNPSLLTDSFLLRTKIVENEKEVASLILTPALAAVNIRKQNIMTSIALDPGTLKIESNDSNEPIRIGELYCKNLPHVVGRAFGINITFKIRGVDPNEWFRSKNLLNHPKDLLLKQLVFQFGIQKGRGSVIVENATSFIQAKFNFHYDFNKKVLGEIGNVSDLKRQNEPTAIDFLTKNFSI